MNEHELYHYGVLGMKWGVRKNPSKAYAKANRKKNKLKDKAVKAELKGAEYERKTKSPVVDWLTPDWYTDHYTNYQASRYNHKAAKLKDKGRKWEKAMDDVFKHYSIERIPDGNLQPGKSFVDRLLYGPDSYNVTPLNKDGD